jgi:hypothetical protein
MQTKSTRFFLGAAQQSTFGVKNARILRRA